MRNTLLLAVAAGALAVMPALAQEKERPPASNGTTPAASEAATRVQSSPGTGQLNPSGAVTAQTPDQWLASKFKGTDVIGPDDKKIGDVDDLLFDRTGSVKAIVIGVGGFLGVGARQVALSLSSFDVVAGKDGAPDRLKLSMTKDQLAAVPEFKPYQPPRQASAPAERPTTSGAATAPAKE